MQPVKAVTIVIVALILTGMCGYFLQPTHEEVTKTTYDYKGDLTPSVIYSQIDDWIEYNPLSNVTGWKQQSGTIIPESDVATPYLLTPITVSYTNWTVDKLYHHNSSGISVSTPPYDATDKFSLADRYYRDGMWSYSSTYYYFGSVLSTDQEVIYLEGGTFWYTSADIGSAFPYVEETEYNALIYYVDKTVIPARLGADGVYVPVSGKSATGLEHWMVGAQYNLATEEYVAPSLICKVPVLTDPAYIDATRFVTIDSGHTGKWENGQVNGTVRVLCTPNTEFVISDGVFIYCPTGLPYDYLLCTLDFHNGQFYCQGVESFNNTLSYTVADYKYNLNSYIQPEYSAPNALIFTEDYRMFVGTLSGDKATGYAFKGYELNSDDLNLPIDSNPSTQYELNVYNVSDRPFRFYNTTIPAYSSDNLITYNARSTTKGVEWTDSGGEVHYVRLGVEVTEEIPNYTMPGSVTGLTVKQGGSNQYGVYQQYNVGTRDAYSHLDSFVITDTSFIFRGDSAGSNWYELNSGDIIYAMQGMGWMFYVGTTESIKFDGITFTPPINLYFSANSSFTLNIERTVDGETIETAIMIRLISSTEWNNCPEKGYALSTFESRIPAAPPGSDVKVFVDSTVVAVDPNGVLWGDPKMPLAYFYPEQMQYDTRVLFNGFVKYGDSITINGTTFPVSDGYLLYTHTVIEEGGEVEVTEQMPLKGMAIDYIKRTGESQFDVAIVFTEKGDYTIEMGALDTTEVTFTYDIQVYDPDTGTTQTVTKTVNTYAGFLVSATGNWYWQSGLYTIATIISDNIGLDLESANFGLTMTASCLLMLFFMILGTAAMYRFTEMEFCAMDWAILIGSGFLLIGIALM